MRLIWSTLANIHVLVAQISSFFPLHGHRPSNEQHSCTVNFRKVIQNLHAPTSMRAIDVCV